MSTLKTTLSIGSALLLTGGAFAQQSAQVQAVPGPVKDRGVFHAASGTWTRTHDTGGTKVLYNNDANTGFFGLFSTPEEWYDEGRLPGTNDPNLPNAKSDSYLVTGFQFAYCTSQGPAGQAGVMEIYEAYASCTNPAALTPVFGPATYLVPGSSAVGVTACWIVTFDFSGTTLEFKMDAEADGIFDNDQALDNFGWLFQLTDTSGGNAGPLLNGDPNNFPEGNGTYYQLPGSTGTGLGTQDQFWLTDPGGTVANGCYWFGGYPTNPYASFWFQLIGENNGASDNCTKYCQANPNSTGAPASLSSNCSFSGRMVTFNSSPVPNQPGIFFHALNQNRLPFGNGFLCATGNIVRTGVVVGAGNMATRTIDFAGFNGQIRYVQYWYRDPAGGGAFFNTSNAICVLVP